jgi:hypothetical protein
VQSSLTTGHSKHNRTREPPLALYLGLNIHAISRSKKLIDHLNCLGLSVSYKRVIQVEDSLAQSVCEQFQEDGVVCPKNMRSGLFTIAAIDNLDHNPSSSTSSGAFHGTTISLFQFPTIINKGETRHTERKIHGSCSTIELPEKYSFVPTILLNQKTVSVSACVTESMKSCLPENIKTEKKWIEQSLTILDEDELTAEHKLGWSSYHASSSDNHIDTFNNPAAICSLMPLF